MRPVLRTLLVGLLLTAGGCDDGPRDSVLDPEYREPMVNAFLIRVEYYDYSVDYERYVEVFDNHGLRMVPLVRLNRETLAVNYYSPTQYRYGDDVRLAVHAKYELDVQHYWGRAFGHVVMPGNFQIASPPERYVMDMESTLVVAWQRSAGAQWYWVQLYIAYDYNDSFGQWNDHEFSLDTAVGDTFIRIAPGRVFPRRVMDVLEGDGSAIVWSGNGPPIEPGDMSNVRGNGFGFFNATNEPREKYFYVGAPPVSRRSPGAREGLAKLKVRLRERLRSCLTGSRTH